MKNNRLFVIAALLGTVLAGCQKIAEIQNPEEKPKAEKGWKLTVKATKNAETRALDYNGTKIVASWETNEIVDVYLEGDAGLKLGSLKVVAVESDGTATLSGTVSVEGVEEGDILKLLYPGTGAEGDPAWTYVGQTGLDPENEYDYASALLEVETLDADTQTIETSSESTDFENLQSYYHFGFKLNGSLIGVSTFIVASSKNQLVRDFTFNGTWTPEYGMLYLTPGSSTTDGRYFASLRNEYAGTDGNYAFSVVGTDDALYEGVKSISKDLSENGKFWTATVNVEQKSYAPLTGAVTENEVL